MNTLICFGDSLVSGYGLRKGEGWCELLQRDNSLSKDWKIINKGIPGDTTTGLLSRSDRDVLKLSPQLVVILIGTNDLLLGRTVDTVFKNLTFIVSELLSYDIKPILLTPPGIACEMAEKNWDSSKIYSTVNNNIESLIEMLKGYSIENKINVIDLYNGLHALINHGIITSYKDLYIDGIHLSKKGNIFIASKVKEIIKV